MLIIHRSATKNAKTKEETRRDTRTRFPPAKKKLAVEKQNKDNKTELL